MSKPINFNQVRKLRGRAKIRAQADANAAKFGRTKAQKTLDEAETEKMRKALDQHRRDPE